jgi:acyl-CoA synthetase (AMP-forming)/AMP-acid ligase II
MIITQPNPNIARYLPEIARTNPDQIAVVKGGARDRKKRVYYEQLTFAELDRQSDAYAWGLTGYGIGQGKRVLLMVPAGLPLIALTFALFKAGCVPVLIDPAMGRQNLAVCIKECEPEALIGVERAHLARLIFRTSFRTVDKLVTFGRRWAWGGTTLNEIEEIGSTVTVPFPIAQVKPDDMAAITFTTGSTGVPKGVVYEHGMFEAQCNILRDFYQIAPGEVEMPAFPLFALFNVAMGVASAIPPIDPTRPASCDPAEVVQFIQEQRVTSTFGSPAIWDKVTAYCLEQNLRLPTLRRVLMAGAPVPSELHQRFEHILEPSANTYTPYGATEALPVASISGREVLQAHAERADPTAGTCVGRPVPGITLRIIAITDEPLPAWDEDLMLPLYQVGEIVVRGAVVTKQYINRPSSTQLAKMQDGDATWHRMGDLGYLDEQGRVWFCGRKSHRVITNAGVLFTEPCERVFNQHPAVFRSALVGVPADNQQPDTDNQNNAFLRPIIVIEPKPGKMPRTAAEREQFIMELLSMGALYSMTAGIKTVLFHPSFPVDIRHNAKIFREKLAVWAEQEVRRKR